MHHPAWPIRGMEFGDPFFRSGRPRPGSCCRTRTPGRTPCRPRRPGRWPRPGFDYSMRRVVTD